MYTAKIITKQESYYLVGGFTAFLVKADGTISCRTGICDTANEARQYARAQAKSENYGRYRVK